MNKQGTANPSFNGQLTVNENILLDLILSKAQKTGFTPVLLPLNIFRQIVIPKCGNIARYEDVLNVIEQFFVKINTITSSNHPGFRIFESWNYDKNDPDEPICVTCNPEYIQK